MTNITVTPIGYFKCDHTYPQLAPRQGVLKAPGETGFIELLPGNNFEQALDDLDTFDRIWLIYLFDRNSNWKPKVTPPRGEKKRGLFATRAPYRPNQIGISCVKLIHVSGLTLEVEDFDLLDGTPILDIKPYLSYADSFPDASIGWLEEHTNDSYQIEYSETALKKCAWVNSHAAYDLKSFVDTQLAQNPTDSKRKRISIINEGMDLYQIAARTWRIEYRINSDTRYVYIKDIHSGYTTHELHAADDQYGDKAFHRAFIAEYGQ